MIDQPSGSQQVTQVAGALVTVSQAHLLQTPSQRQEMNVGWGTTHALTYVVENWDASYPTETQYAALVPVTSIRQLKVYVQQLVSDDRTLHDCSILHINAAKPKYHACDCEQADLLNISHWVSGCAPLF